MRKRITPTLVSAAPRALCLRYSSRGEADLSSAYPSHEVRIIKPTSDLKSRTKPYAEARGAQRRFLGAFWCLTTFIGCTTRLAVSPERMRSLPMYKSYQVESTTLAKLQISANQRNWIRAIISTPGYSERKSALRVSLTKGIRTPIVVFESSLDEESHERGGHIIGENCNVIFDPYDHGIFPGSQASCSPPTPLPVSLPKNRLVHH